MTDDTLLRAVLQDPEGDSLRLVYADWQTDMQTGVLKAGQGKAYWVVGDRYTILCGADLPKRWNL
jgi:uncharacterized protein (TIGR02996 family)